MIGSGSDETVKAHLMFVKLSFPFVNILWSKAMSFHLVSHVWWLFELKKSV